MAFPTNPTNGQQATVNGITYTYSTATTSWNVTTAFASNFTTLSATGTITGGNVATSGTVSASGNVTGSYILGNGSQLTGISTGIAGDLTGNLNGNSYGANAFSFVSATGNITGSYIIGNGSQLTGLPASYNDANVATFMSAFGSNTISTTGNITGSYIIGNGSQLTGLPASYGNANVATFMAAFGSNTIVTTGNITGGNLTTVGTMTAATVTETSSIALKENFRPIEDPLEKVLQLLGVIYDRKDGSSTNEVGLVAEDVEKVIPELVKNNSVAYTRLTVYLLESIKVLKEEIDQLKGKK